MLIKIKQFVKEGKKDPVFLTSHLQNTVTVMSCEITNQDSDAAN